MSRDKEEIEMLVVGAGCSICGVVLSDDWLVIKKQHPFIVDEKILQLVRQGAWDLLKEMLKEAQEQWDVRQQSFRNDMNAERRGVSGEVVPFMITTKRNYIANEVHERLDEMRKEPDDMNADQDCSRCPACGECLIHTSTGWECSCGWMG